MGFFQYCMGKDIEEYVVGSSNSLVQTEEDAFDKRYKLTGKLLGEGGFSTVKEARDRNSKSYAVKIIKKWELTSADIKGLEQEVEILQILDHPNIIKLHNVYHEHKFCYLVTEIMSGGELFDRIAAKMFYDEREARNVCKVLFEAIKYCHDHNVVHRDLKPENLLLMSYENDMDIKIADFGFAKITKSDHYLRSQCGTPGYVAPEVICGTPYGTKADMFSLGVIMYIILAGYHPFNGESRSETLRMTTRGDFRFHREHWNDISTDAMNLISELLTLNPTKRRSASDALHSKWIQNEKLGSQHLEPNLELLKEFNAKRKWKQGIFAVIAAGKMAALIEEKRENQDSQ
jgi:calcium/calmodulin-dependent protein kinase I